MQSPSHAGMDPVLRPFLDAADDEQRQHAAGRILAEHAAPVITKVIRRRLHVPLDREHPDGEDLREQVLVQLLDRMEALRSRPGERPIADLAAYAAVMAYHACDHYLRQLNPARRRLEAAQDTRDEDEPHAYGGPPAETVLDRQRYLERVWDEVCLLPPRQRAALLLNLRDREGRDGLDLFVLTGTASLRQLAEVLEMPAEEFAALWKELPLDDARLAQRLGLTRQQVANLRKCARERLARRLTAAGFTV